MSNIKICDEEGYSLIPIFVVKKPKSTIAVVKESSTNEDFLVVILGEDGYGGLHRLEVKIGDPFLMHCNLPVPKTANSLFS